MRLTGGRAHTEETNNSININPKQYWNKHKITLKQTQKEPKKKTQSPILQGDIENSGDADWAWSQSQNSTFKETKNGQRRLLISGWKLIKFPFIC